MVEKQKALELYESYIEYSCCADEHNYAVKSALIHVNGILDVIQDKQYSKHLMVNDFFQYSKNIQYWQVVKEELKLMLVNQE